MVTKVRDILKRRAQESFVGRKDEKTTLLRVLEETGPLVVFVHGIAGIGKSSLLEAFSEEARARGAAVIRLDCRSMEPTERGFLHGLSIAIGSDVRTVDEAAERLGRLGKRVVLALDTYEIFRMMDTWLRSTLIPALHDNVRLVIAGREGPVSAWATSAEWEGLFRDIPLGPLGEKEALELLSNVGVAGEKARRINRVTHGHPLASRLAAFSMTDRLAIDLEQAAIQRIVEELTRLYMSDVPDALTRKVLEAASVIRCATQSLLKAMLPEMAPQDAFDRLQALPFVTSGRDGLVLHDAVREAIAVSLKASNPNAYRDYRRAAWRQLRAEVRSASVSELWRYSADMIYILDNTAVRDAYFPPGVHQFAVSPARREDSAAILAIIDQWEGPEATKALKLWWQRAPETFYVARDSGGKVAGFQSIFDPTPINPTFLREDPILKCFCDHLRHNPIPANQRVLFSRQWLATEHGEKLSPEAGAIFLDCKRMYLTMRPYLRRVYVSVTDTEMFGSILKTVGFQFVSKFKLDQVINNVGVLDMGPGSVDGWLAGLVAKELGVEEGGILDIDARELVLDRHRVALTPLEFGVMNYLCQREGKAVSRVVLVDNVWGYSYEGGSNVTDAIVLALRKKLGERASVIETVRGVGYRFRNE